MSTPPILILRKGTASSAEIALVRKAGVVVLTVKDPNDVRYLEAPLTRVGRLPAVAIKLVRQAMSDKYGKIDRDNIRDELFRVFMEDTQPEPPKPLNQSETTPPA
jgi:hypothetical protein